MVDKIIEIGFAGIEGFSGWSSKEFKQTYDSNFSFVELLFWPDCLCSNLIYSHVVEFRLTFLQPISHIFEEFQCMPTANLLILVCGQVSYL